MRMRNPDDDGEPSHSVVETPRGNTVPNLLAMLCASTRLDQLGGRIPKPPAFEAWKAVLRQEVCATSGRHGQAA